LSHRTALALGLTVGSAWLTALAFPEARVWVLAWIGVAPFLAALRLSGVRAAPWLGALWALVFSVAVGAWLADGMAFYFEQPRWFGWLCFLAMLALLVMPWLALFAAAYRAFAERFEFALPLLAAAAWVAAEWGRGALFTATGFLMSNPWALLGYAQAPHEWLVQILDLTGVYGLSFLALLVNATLADVALAAWRGTLREGRAAAALGLALVPTLAALAYGRAVLPPPALESGAVPVAVVQGHIGLAERWHRHFHGRNLQTYLELTDQVLRASGAELVVWPEAAMTFIYEEEPGYRRAIAQLLGARGAELVAGVPHQGEDGVFLNSAVLFSEDAQPLARYDKQLLLPFAEYLPLRRFERVRQLFGRFREFAHGGPAVLLPTRAGAAGVLICNEAVLPEAARARVRAGAEILVNPSNDSWSRHPKFTGQWFDIVRFRAIETRRYLVRASTSGPSAVIDPWGRVQEKTAIWARGTAAGAVAPRRELSLYVRVGDAFSLSCTLVVLAALALSRRSLPADRAAQRSGPAPR
jgi:apolipoprotein N-acyltransferase